MTTRLALTHRAFFRFEKPRDVSAVALRLLPEPGHPVGSAAVDIKPEPGRLIHSRDIWGNRLVRASFSKPIPELQVSLDLILEVGDSIGGGFTRDPFAGLAPEERFFAGGDDPARHAFASPGFLDASASRAIDDLARPLAAGVSPSPDGVRACAGRVQSALRSIHPVNAAIRDPAAILRAGTASAAEMAHVFALLLYRAGYAVRLATGYAIGRSQSSESGESLAEWRSWVQVFHPVLGWVGMDPRDGHWTGDDYVLIAVGSEPSETLPFPAVLAGDGVDFSEYLDARTLHAAIPASSAEREQVLASAEHEADRRLRRAGVRLQTASTLRLNVRNEHIKIDESGILSGPMVDALRQSAPGSLSISLHGPSGSGGCAIVFREDGEPLWNDATPMDPGGRPVTPEVARKFLEALAGRLKIDPTFILEGYEDPLWHMIVEGELPPELEMDAADAREGRERRRLLSLLDRGLQSPAGFVLPLGFDVYSNRWNTCSWKFRRGRLYLIPGVDPMGVRIPVRSVSDHFARAPVPDPFFRRPPLSQTTRALYQHEMVYTAVHQAHPIETALCVEIREGRLHVFLPALDRLEAWLDLLASIEKCARKVAVDVSLEAADVPLDHRLKVIRLLPAEGADTADVVLPFSPPGDDASRRAVFALLDGKSDPGDAVESTCTRHRLLLGNAVPEESPFFARPELLARFIRFWQTHPSLAVLLSADDPVVAASLSGPTGAVLRDELELGLRSLEKGARFPWDVDRALRMPLTHVPGGLFSLPWISTAELYAPEGYPGRRGAVSMEALAGPATFRELRVQTALVVAILAMLSEQAPRHAVVAGDGAHDHAFLPLFARREMDEVLRELAACGMVFDAGMVEPFFLRRFPVIGECSCEGVRFELQHALEPGMGVPSRTRRLQLLVHGWFRPGDRLACNGALLPLRSTGVEGEYVAAVRYAAVPEEHVLQFDIFDTVNHRSAGGFRLQGGELLCGRHSIGRWKIPATIDSPTHPLTVDLRFLP